MNYRGFLETFRDLYKNDKFAAWIIGHKENVDKIIAKEGFLTGFRYDILVWANAFAYQVTTDTGAESAVDISKLRKDIRYNVLSTTRQLEEIHYTDNPYAKGGEKFGFDPRTGKPKANKKKDHNDFTNSRGNNRGQGRGRSSYWMGGGDYRTAGDYNNHVASNTPNQWADPLLAQVINQIAEGKEVPDRPEEQRRLWEEEEVQTN
ncbi:hypothetical protein PCANC_28640 [Puccinia coronata f. sp. avenae]|uniref:Uncharacterized protein n=1 Tax=Puccinia coronata f. sp. avenae TaxID=200324 RepID=A0A2N5T9U4_9BASI|nr:hypothetical protein PCANC_28640 [Puccinia coronata f. sp. avenae]